MNHLDNSKKRFIEMKEGLSIAGQSRARRGRVSHKCRKVAAICPPWLRGGVLCVPRHLLGCGSVQLALNRIYNCSTKRWCLVYR